MIAFPIRLGGNGRLALVADRSLDALAQRIRHVTSCRPGERPLAPAYGIPDPTDGAEPGVIAALIEMCEPDVAVSAVTVATNGDVDVDARWTNQEDA